ncbi:hypothetical protein KIN20_005289 [Parelaphostrongylus tenuis]|uniref:Uncharacterized protein n=1 Tax=Parelaphostrongylus tenuis TaxID=148309 RepID=A0AAD5MSK1_PARTN|nr:hypothetical protein KIN20_005289 [Parelaphostrongylus tenuis]
MPPSLINHDKNFSHITPSVFIIYRWYLYCCSQETVKEMRNVDRQRIFEIDAESLASSSFYESPRLLLKRNSIELCSTGECRPSLSLLNGSMEER